MKKITTLDLETLARRGLRSTVMAAASCAIALAFSSGIACAARLAPLQVAYAGSMGSMMDGGIKPAVATTLKADLRGRAQGSMGLANLIASGNIRPDVFIAVTPGPMRRVLDAGKATEAVPIARTEMVVAYSPHSRFAPLFAKANKPGAEPWWKILESPGLKFGRTDPRTDPQGLNTLFMTQLAGDYYKQKNLAGRVLGKALNPRQIFQESEVMARLQAGQIDASSAYGVQPRAFGLPFVRLPAQINLGDASMEKYYRQATVTLDGKTHHPSPLVFYAAVLKGASNPALARRFVGWLQGSQARKIFARYHYDEPGHAQPLR